MTIKKKIQLIKEKVKHDFNGIEKIETKIIKGKVQFTYHMVQSITTYPEDIDKIIIDGIESSKKTIAFLRSLQKIKS